MSDEGGCIIACIFGALLIAAIFWFGHDYGEECKKAQILHCISNHAQTTSTLSVHIKAALNGADIMGQDKAAEEAKKREKASNP